MDKYRNEQWYDTVKKVDPDFEGSVHQQLGLLDILCPTCGAHCKLDDNKELICLNACHLIQPSQEKFHQLFLLLGNANLERSLSQFLGRKEEEDNETP